jgi:S1-C subfamily serine protease
LCKENAITINATNKIIIAIIKVNGLETNTYLCFAKNEPKQGDKICTYGFPHSNIEGSDCKYSSGEISSLVGLGSDKRYMRLNLQVSSGNSGGPLLDAANLIVGLLTAKLDSIKMLEETGDLPTGISYAVKKEWILNLIEKNGLTKRISFNKTTGKPSESIILISAE